LEENIKEYSTVTLKRGEEAIDIIQEKDKTCVKIVNLKNKKEDFYECKFLCGCDGKKSLVREKLKIEYKGGKYRQTFLMADFIDETHFGDNAHLFFTSKGPVESFPLPDKKRRWIVDTKEYMENPDKTFLADEVYKRTRIKLDTAKKISESPFGVQHYLASSYYKNNVILCGDAAHVMSPIGGQGMNTGFSDAEFCVFIIDRILKNSESMGFYLKKYEYYRKIAARTSITRAALSMNTGTIKGFFISGIRNFIIKYFMLLFSNKISVIFSMLTIPYVNILKVTAKDKLFFKCDNFKESKK
jgi:2-polyprenyl-6-methoxyphenol hydroxylase-like FAD-dependent oxidoreductase